MAELSAGPVSAAALLNPQCQREIIEQAAGMTTRQVAGLLATAAPEIVPQRDTLRAVAPDRFTLKVSIDRECEQGLRHLKDLRSHLDPRMSWGDLVALLVREAVARHDPRGGGRRPGRAGSTEASSRRGRSRTPAVVPPAPRAGGGGGDTPVPQFASASPADRSVVALVPQSAAPAPKSARRGAADGSDAAPVPHDTAPAPNFSSGGAQSTALMSRRGRRALLRRRSWQAACRPHVEPAVRRPDHRRRSPVLLRAVLAGRRYGAPYPRRSGATSGCATGGAAAIAIRSPGAGVIPPTYCRSTTCSRLPKVAARSRPT